MSTAQLAFWPSGPVQMPDVLTWSVLMSKSITAGRTSPPVPSRAAILATRSVFASGVPLGDVQNAAAAFIKGCFCYGPPGPPRPDLPDLAFPELLAAADRLRCQHGGRNRVWKIILNGSQRDLQRLTGEELNAPLKPPKNYAFSGSVEHWLRHLVHGGLGADLQLEKDLGLDVARHAANLRTLRSAWPKGWRMLCRADLSGLRSDPNTPSTLAPLVGAIITEHLVVLGMVRARFLGEYLRRLATEPMGPALSADDPVWSLCGATLMDRVVKPAISVDKLMQRKCDGRSAGEVIQDAIGSRNLALDPRLLQLARNIYRQCGEAVLDAAGDKITAAVRGNLAPVLAITPATLRDEGLSRLSFAEARLDLPVSEAVTVLAMSLVALPARTRHMLEALARGERLSASSAVPPKVPHADSRVRRIAAALKRISGCDRHAGSTSTDSDNKAGRALLHRTRKRLDTSPLPHGLDLLRIAPDEWLS